MLICPGSSIAWMMSTQSYDDDYDGDDDDDDTLDQQEFRAGNIRSLICFSLIKAPRRKETRLEILSKCVNRTLQPMVSFGARPTVITESSVLLWQGNLQERLCTLCI